MKSIAVGPREVNLPFIAPDGSRPIVVATPNEHVSSVLARVEAAGGTANVALAEAQRFTVFVIRGTDGDNPSEDGELTEVVNKDLSMGMLWLRASRKRSGKANYRLRDGASIAPAQSQEFAYA